MYVLCNHLVQKNIMSILAPKKPLFSPIWGRFSVHKSEKSKFLAWIHMEYFHVGIFVISGVCLIRKYGSRNTAFFSVFQCSLGCRVPQLLAKPYAVSFSLLSEEEWHWPPSHGRKKSKKKIQLKSYDRFEIKYVSKKMIVTKRKVGLASDESSNRIVDSWLR